MRRGTCTGFQQQGGELIGSGSSLLAHQGWSVALDSDASVLATGGFSDSNSAGATWIFERAAGHEWHQQGEKLVGKGGAGNTAQGYSLAMSADGFTLAVGGWWDNDYTGAVWVFTRDDAGSKWLQQGSKLVGSGVVGQAQIGYSVALASDGATLAVSAPFDNGAGSAWVFVRSPGGKWTQMGGKIVGETDAYSDQGRSVALCPDGSILAVGGGQGQIGATWVFTRSGRKWLPGGKLVGSGVVGDVAAQGQVHCYH